MTLAAEATSRPSVRSFSAYGVAQVVPGLLGVASVPLWIRIFGAADYGRYAVAWAISVSAVALGTGWVRQAALRGSSGPRPAESVPAWSWVVSVLVAGVAAAGIAAPVIGLSTALPVLVSCAALGVAMLVGTALQRREQASRFMVLEATRAALGVVAVVALHLLGAGGLPSLLLGSALGNALAALFAPRGQRATVVSRAVLARWWHYGWPMSPWLALAPVLLYGDRVVLSGVLGAHALGVYAAASDLVVRGTTLLGLTVTMTLHPTVMRLVNQGRAVDAYALLHTWRVRGALGVVALALAAAVVAPPLVRLVVGAAPGRTVLVALTAAGAVWQLASLLHKPLEIEARTRTMLGALAAAVVGQVALMALVARVWGQTGVSLALLAGVVGYAVATLLQARPIERAAWTRS